MDKIDIVMQGAVDDFGEKIARYYAQLSFVDRVIVSSWDNQTPRLFFGESKIYPIFSKDPENPGIYNRNRQIKSSFEGLKIATADTVVKLRTDQLIPHEELQRMYDFYDGETVHVAGIFQPFPFHPRDHWFWGPRNKVLEVFDIPHDPITPDAGDDYTKYVRSETYIAMWYAALYDERVKKMISNPREYLVDNAPKIQEALNVSDKLTPEIFKPFPRINFLWPKYYGNNGYPYDHKSKDWGEFWAD